MIQVIMVLMITILSLLLVYQPKLDWNYQTKQLLLWYNVNNERKYIVLW